MKNNMSNNDTDDRLLQLEEQLRAATFDGLDSSATGRVFDRVRDHVQAFPKGRSRFGRDWSRRLLAVAPFVIPAAAAVAIAVLNSQPQKAIVPVPAGTPGAFTTPEVSPSVVPSPSLVPSPSPADVSSPTPTQAEVADARRAAVGLFVANPSLAGHWDSCPNANNWAACPLSATVRARLAELTSRGYFGDIGGCGEDYITGTQNGFNRAPMVLSAVAGSNGSVAVIIQRGPSRPALTVVMIKERGRWLASDLASGTGPAASIFSAKPDC